MKLVATLFLLADSLFFARAAQAQTSFSIGPQIGLTNATSSFKKYGTPFNTTRSTGLEAGVQAGIALGQHLALQPALLYSQLGFGIDNTRSFDPKINPFVYHVDEHYRFNYLTLALQVAYRTGADGKGFQVFGGPYGAFLLGGNYSANDINEWASGAGLVHVENGRIERGDQKDFSSFNTTYHMPGLDAGIQAGIGYRVSSVLLQASYSLGLVNLGSDYDVYLQRTDYYNRAFHFSASYLFNLTSKVIN